MPSERLAKQQRELMLREGATVSYQPFDFSSATIDPDYNEPANLEDCYPTSVELDGVLITYQPSEAQRTRLGLEEDVDALLDILLSEIEAKNLTTIETSGRFLLPGYDEPFYVVRPRSDQQSNSDWLTMKVAVRRKTGGTRHR